MTIPYFNNGFCELYISDCSGGGGGDGGGDGGGGRGNLKFIFLDRKGHVTVVLLNVPLQNF